VLITDVLSLDRWDLVLTRLEEYLSGQRHDLKRNLTPVELDLTTRDLLLPRAQAAHRKVFELIKDLNNALRLETSMRISYHRAEVTFGLQDLEDRIRGIQNLSMLCEEIKDAPSRLEVLHELEHAHKQFESLRVAGEGDIARTERQRLRGLRFKLPAVGHEDFENIRNYHISLKAQLDHLTAERSQIRAGSGFHLEVEDEDHALLFLLGVPYQVMPGTDEAPAQEVAPVDSDVGEADIPPEAPSAPKPSAAHDATIVEQSATETRAG